MSSGYQVTLTCPCGAKFSVDASSYAHGEEAEKRFVEVHRRCTERAVELQTNRHVQEVQLYAKLHHERGLDCERMQAAFVGASRIADDLSSRLRVEMQSLDDANRKVDKLTELVDQLLLEPLSPQACDAIRFALSSIKSETKPPT